jgi:serine/threonine kinase 16
MQTEQVVAEKSDVWSLGCLLFKMCFLQNAFEENKLAAINGNYTIPASSPYSERVHNLFKYIFVLDPDARPSVFDLLSRLSQLRGFPLVSFQFVVFLFLVSISHDLVVISF